MPIKQRKRFYEQDMELFKNIAQMNKKKLQFFLFNVLKSYGYNNICNSNTFMFAEGDLPVCLCAHMDTVFAQTPDKFYYDAKEAILWSPSGMGADDRAGIVIILKLLRDGYRPSIVFTDLEEKGGVGADHLVSKYGNCPFKECKAIIELDRRGINDAVYYSCDNKDFERKINSYGFKTEWGTFSDISIIAPIWEIAAVNLSVGYENEHTSSEILSMEGLDLTYLRVKKMLKECDSWPSYAYIPETYSYFSILADDGKEKCICCGDPLGEYYYNYKYEGDTFKICPHCYEVCFAPNPIDE